MSLEERPWWTLEILQVQMSVYATDLVPLSVIAEYYLAWLGAAADTSAPYFLLDVNPG
jgi:hypothetical protein